MLHVANLRRAALCLLAVPVLALAACGGDNVPGNAVAKVDDRLTPKQNFDHWRKAAAISSRGAHQTSGAPPTAQVPAPPSFTACVANKKKTAAKPAKGQPQPKDSDYK